MPIFKKEFNSSLTIKPSLYPKAHLLKRLEGQESLDSTSKGWDLFISLLLSETQDYGIKKLFTNVLSGNLKSCIRLAGQ